MVTVSHLQYPKKSHRKAVLLPRESDQFAEFMGIMMGDGGINNPWQANITVNSVADKDYVGYVSNLAYSLFGVRPAVRSRTSCNATVISLSSTSVVDFLVDKGLCRGNKLRQHLQIPEWIIRKKTYKIACVRGLVDTDGCMVMHSRAIAGKTYTSVYLSFCSASPALLEQVAHTLLELGMFPKMARNGREVYLYRKRDVRTYLEIIGTSNPRISGIYNTWRDG